MNHLLDYFRGKGNAFFIKRYVESEFPPLSWNIVNMKLMLNVKNEEVEYDEDTLLEINQTLLKITNNKKGLPIF